MTIYVVASGGASSCGEREALGEENRFAAATRGRLSAVGRAAGVCILSVGGEFWYEGVSGGCACFPEEDG